MRYYYAESDSFTGDDPIGYCSGFANTKEPIAFRLKKLRNLWVECSLLLTAKKLCRNEVLKMVKWETPRYGEMFDKVKYCKIYNSNDYIVIAHKNY